MNMSQKNWRRSGMTTAGVSWLSFPNILTQTDFCVAYAFLFLDIQGLK